MGFPGQCRRCRVAYQDLRPVIEQKDPALATTLDAKFAEVQQELDRYKRGDGFVLYTELTTAQVKALAASVDAGREPVEVDGDGGVVTMFRSRNRVPDRADHASEAGSHAQGCLAVDSWVLQEWGRSPEQGCARGSCGCSRREYAVGRRCRVLVLWRAPGLSIVTPAQDRLHFTAFDLTSTSRADLVRLQGMDGRCGTDDAGRGRW